MIIIPAIDLLGGKVVRLKQGNYNQRTVYAKDPAAKAVKFVNQGAKYLHIVDLDGARAGKMNNLKAILQIRNQIKIPLQVGGGIRTEKQIKELLSRGINRVILGTRAIEEPEFLARALREFGKERIVVSLDVCDGRVMVRGWQSVLLGRDFMSRPRRNDVPQKGCRHEASTQLLRRFQLSGLKYLIYTDIKKDGMMSSPNFPAIKGLQKYGFNLIISGGISSLDDIKKLQEIGVCGCIIGRAVYEDDGFLEKALKL